MTIEKAVVLAVDKPWGRMDLRPWSGLQHDGAAIGELWFERANSGARRPDLLLKLIFANEALSIQVHPDDNLAWSLGQPNGKTEAWYIVSATPGAQVALGLKRRISTAQLRSAIDDGSIADLARWCVVTDGTVVFVPAGTIHAIGAGLIIAEIQQRSDTTFRLYDFDRNRGLDIESALAAAFAGPAAQPSAPQTGSFVWSSLIACPHFELDCIDLIAAGHSAIHAERETWFLALEGSAEVGPINVRAGEAIFLEAETAHIFAGSEGLKGLCARSGCVSQQVSIERQEDWRAASSFGPASPTVVPPPAFATASVQSMEVQA